MKRSVVAIVAVVAVALSVFLVMWSDREGDALDPDTRGRQPDRRISAALRSRDSVITRDRDPIGTLQLEGLVVDAGDRPVANATVTLSSNPPRTATTSEDGSFALDKLVPGAYTLVARTELASAGPVTTQLTESSEPVTLRLVPAAALEVTVTSAAGRAPIGDATVEVRSLDLRAARTGDRGTVRIGGVTPGIHEIAAWAPGFARSFAIVRVPVGNTANTVAVQVAIALRRGAPVTGKVYDEQGRTVANARVSFVVARLGPLARPAGARSRASCLGAQARAAPSRPGSRRRRARSDRRRRHRVGARTRAWHADRRRHRRHDFRRVITPPVWRDVTGSGSRSRTRRSRRHHRRC